MQNTKEPQKSGKYFDIRRFANLNKTIEQFA